MLTTTRRDIVIGAGLAGIAFGLDKRLAFIAPAHAQKTPDPASGFLEPSLRDRIPFQHDAIPRRDGQDIRGHPVELGVGDVDEIESVGLKALPKGNRQKSRIDDREIVVHEADQRHQMKACRGARVEREWHRFGPDAEGLE